MIISIYSIHCYYHLITLLCKYSQINLMQMNLIPESPQAVICKQSKLNKYQETLKNIIEALINNVHVISY